MQINNKNPNTAIHKAIPVGPIDGISYSFEWNFYTLIYVEWLTGWKIKPGNHLPPILLIEFFSIRDPTNFNPSMSNPAVWKILHIWHSFFIKFKRVSLATLVTTPCQSVSAWFIFR